MSRLWKIIIFSALIILTSESTVTSNDSFDSAITKILDLKPSQITILRDENAEVSNSTEFNLILGKISCEIPTFTISIDKTKALNKNQEMKKIWRALKSDLFVTIESVWNFNAQIIEKKLNKISELNPSPPREKFLLVIIGNSRSFKIDFENLFFNAWTLKFLDFSVLLVNGMDEPWILNYNPFFKSRHQIEVSKGQLFPDKLKNMNGYKIKTLLFNRPPHIEFSKNLNEIIIKGGNNGFWKHTSEFFNFKFEFLSIDEKTKTDSYIFGKIDGNEIDASIITHILGTQLTDLHKKGALIGKAVKEANLHLVVPIRYHTPKSKIDLKIITYSCSTALIIIFTMLIVRLCKLTAILWSPFYVLGLLFGVTMDKRPQKLFERLIYISFAIVSIQYSSEMFAVFNDDGVVKNEEIDYNAFEEVKNPSMTLYLGNSMFQNGENYDDEVISNLRKHAVLVEKTEEFYERKDCFIINSAVYAEYMIEKNLNPDKSAKMKLAYPIILSDFFAHLFAKGSPYFKKFDRKFQQIFESGLQGSYAYSKKYFEAYKSENHDVQFQSNNDISKQVILFTIGCIISIIAFLFEVILKSK